MSEAPAGTATASPPTVARTVALTVAVRTLCEFAAKHGDLDARFTPAPTSEQGMAGHRSVVQSRGPGYRAEVSLQGTHGRLQVRGRADGVDLERQLVEEIKTYRGSLARMPENQRALHWAQAKVYGWLLCQQHQAAAWNVALVYFHADRQEEAPPMVQAFDAGELQAFFESLCARFMAWAEREAEHREQRDASLAKLAFVHGSFREGQRALAEAVFLAARRGHCLAAQAPTGIGKTVGTLFPLLKAMPEQSLDKIFFLSAKGPGRGVALEALETLRASGAAPLRVVELVARDKACVHRDKECHPESCPLARGFYDRLPAARSEAAAHGVALSRQALQDVAERHAVCPYYLGQEMARWADMIVGDYNHYFDVSASLHAMTLIHGWRVAVLVDEAHNLIDRARSCYTAELDWATFGQARTAAPALLKKPIDRVARAWRALARAHPEPYQVVPALPATLGQALSTCTQAIGDLLADGVEGPHGLPTALLDFHWAALHFLRLAESYDASHSLVDVATRPPPNGRRGKPQATVCVRNVTPADFLKPRFAAARSVVLFSATLAPMQFYADTLGLPEDTAWLDVASAFSAEQLKVRIVPNVSTRFHRRADSVAPIAALIARQYAQEPGNYLAFFSSFDYLQQVADAFEMRHGDVQMWRQTRSMDDAARQAFLGRFEPQGRGVGFAVLGGAFAEGIDLPGSRLIGAVIATLGLPQVNPVNEALRERLEQRFGAGFDYTYLYPGLRKVVQAAGRVLRTPTDRGSVHLIDERFRRADVRRLLPAWWRIETLDWPHSRPPAGHADAAVTAATIIAPR
jgi:DNA excision repair protein ERCC-2